MDIKLNCCCNKEQWVKKYLSQVFASSSRSRHVPPTEIRAPKTTHRTKTETKTTVGKEWLSNHFAKRIFSNITMSCNVF